MKKIDQKGVVLLAELEGLRLKPYKCTAGVPTIGLGNTYYADGRKVTMKDKAITKEQAYELFYLIAPVYEKAVNDSVTSAITQEQFNALFCFCYNVGVSAFKKSTLLKVVNKTPNNKELIINAFMMWKGKNNILLSRQQKQIKHYFNER